MKAWRRSEAGNSRSDFTDEFETTGGNSESRNKSSYVVSACLRWVQFCRQDYSSGGRMRTQSEGTQVLATKFITELTSFFWIRSQNRDETKLKQRTMTCWPLQSSTAACKTLGLPPNYFYVVFCSNFVKYAAPIPVDYLSFRLVGQKVCWQVSLSNWNM